MFKKPLAILFLCAIMLTGCTGDVSVAGTPAPTQTEEVTQTPQTTAAPYEVFSMLGLSGLSDAAAPNDQLTPIWREKTGVQMQVETIPSYEDYDIYLEKAVKEDTLPDVLALSEGIFDVQERLALLISKNLLKPIDYETAKVCMPLTAQRLESMGVSFDEWFYANADEQGLWYAVPQLPSELFDASLRTTRFGIDETQLDLAYFWVRDDWLTAVNLYVADETSFRRLYEVFADNMTIEYVCDFRPNTLEDWSRFFADIQDYAYANFHLIKPVLPTYGDSAGSVVWSLYGASGLAWNDRYAEFPNNLPEGGNAFEYYADMPGWKTYLRWLNDCVNREYTDLTYSVNPSMAYPELFADQYAVLNQWVEPQSGISSITSEPYGWRYYPVLTQGVLEDLQNNSLTYLTLASDGAVGFHARLSDSQLETLLGWVDWNYSLEAADLRQWGASLSEGEGAQRRFRYDYEMLADAMLGDESKAQASWEYGLVNVLDLKRTYWNHEVYGVGAQVTASHPFYTYPLTEIDYDQKYFVTYVVKQYLLDLVLDMRYVRVRDDRAYVQALRQYDQLLDEFKASFAQEVSLKQQEALIEAIMAPQGSFDAYYSRYLAVYENSQTKKEYESALRDLIIQIREAAN